MEDEPISPEVQEMLDFATIGMAVHGLQVILNPDTFPIVGEDFRNAAIADAERLGWFEGGVLNAPPWVMKLVLKNDGSI